MKLGVKKVIEVTKKDILKGKPQMETCPVALAIKREFSLSKDEYLCVNTSGISVSESFYFKTPKEVKKFIKDFDDCFNDAEELENEDKLESLKPFKFTLEL